MKKKKGKTLFEEVEKIRDILGRDYHLGVEWGEADNIVNWALYRNYKDSDVFFSNDNKPIMTSDNYQLEDLYNYAKSHHKINIPREFSKICVILAIIVFVILILNSIFLKNRYLAFFIFGFDICFLILDIIVFTLDQQNFKVEMLELDEIFHKNLKQIIDKIETAKEKNKNVKGKQKVKIEETKPQKRKAGRPKKNEKSTTN